MDRIYLLNSWPFLIPHLKYVAEHLKNKAKTVHDIEQAKCPQRSYRLASSAKPTTFFKERGGNKPARSLIELTDDRHVFEILHVAFVWILKASGNRISETLLEGPPTEDSIIDMEKQEGVCSLPGFPLKSEVFEFRPSSRKKVSILNP